MNSVVKMITNLEGKWDAFSNGQDFKIDGIQSMEARYPSKVYEQKYENESASDRLCVQSCTNGEIGVTEFVLEKESVNQSN